MASPPVTAPSQNNSSPSGSKNSSSPAANPPSSPKTPSSPPPASPPPPAKSSPSPPPPKSSSPPPPAASPPPKQSPPPPQQQHSPSPPPPVSPNSGSPEQKSHPPPPPAAPNTPSTPETNSTQTFSPPPPPVTNAEKSPPGSAAKLAPPPPSRNEGSNKSPASSSSSGSSSSSSGRSPAGMDGSSSSSHSTTIAVVTGIGVAVGVLIIALAVYCVVCGKKKKRKHYYMDPVGPPPGNEYYNASSAQWNSPQDHVVKLPPPPGMMGTPVGPGGGGGWGQPTPLTTVSTSKEFSSGVTPQHVPLSPPGPNMTLGFSKSQFTYEELSAATGAFSKVNLLGQGGFGYVHKGVFPNGQEVAVKSLKSGSGQGEREFQAEVEIISRVHHRHLVSLVGYCIADGQRMLVYEFVANKTMEFHLHGKNQPVMDWSTRLRIALGSAKGLGYLHEDCHPKIIHRDIKAANILLDNNFEAMVADFGLAKLSSDNYTHVSTRVMGTFGYMAPEYASSGKLTDKSDVFSFGVMLLELITGRRPIDLSGKFTEEDSLVDWARPLLTKALEEGEYKELVDPRLGDNYNPQEMARMVACAAASIRHSARRRPKMSQIVRALDGDSSLDDLNEGGKAGHGSAYNGNTETYDTNAYNADMMKFRKMVMTSQEFTSSEYGTSDYGHNPSSTSSDSREMDGHSGNMRQKV